MGGSTDFCSNPPRALTCLALAALALTGAAPAAPMLERKVWIIGIDGLRPDALAVANTPNIDSLIVNGLYSDQAQVGPNTWSGPGWSNMLTGVCLLPRKRVLWAEL